MRKPTPISEDAKRSLQVLLRASKKKSEFQRVQCIWLRALLNLDAAHVALALGWHIDTVRHLQAQYLKKGEAALGISGKGGRYRENLSIDEETKFLAPFFKKAESGGILVATEIKDAYEKFIGRTIPKSTIYRILARHGWRKIAPRPKHPKADIEAQETFKKTLVKSLRKK